MKKKWLAILMSAVMVMAVGCGNTKVSSDNAENTEIPKMSQAENQTLAADKTETATARDTYKVYLITMDQIDQNWVNMDQGCQKAVDELTGIEYKWSAPDQKDDAKQIECINNAVADQADAILLAANGPDACVAALEEAAAGVKIIYVDSPANLEAIQTLATDNEGAGESGGEEMLKALEAAGIKTGKIGIITPNAATNSNVNREKGFRKALEGKGFEILETQYSEGDAAKSKDIAANYIAQGCVGIFGCNEGCTVGIGNAIKEAGTGVMGIGFDKSDTILELVKEGSLVCTITQNPDKMGYEGIKTAVKALENEDTGESYVDTGVSVVNAASLK